MIAETPKQIRIFGLLSLKQRLKLEAKGMKCRGESATSQVRRILNTTTRDRNRLLAELVQHIEKVNSES